MAKISPILGPLSGSVGGLTYARNKGGLYVKMKATPTNPNTARQQSARGLLATASIQWQELTDDQRNAWDTYAAANPRTDPLGQSYNLTGHQMYVSLATVIMDQGLAPSGDPPAGGAPKVLSTVTVTLTSDTAINVVFTASPLAAAEALYVWQGPPQGGAGDPNFAQSRLVGYSAQAATSPQAFTLPLVVSSGFTSNFWVGIVDGDGRMGPALKDSDTRP